MACANNRKITAFFQSLPKVLLCQNRSNGVRKQREDHRLFSKLTQGTPLTIRWTTRAEPHKKCDKRGPGRQRKIHEDEIEVIEIDQESGESDGEICTGEGALPLPKTKCMYTVHQKKHVVVVAREEAVTTASNTSRSFV